MYYILITTKNPKLNTKKICTKRFNNYDIKQF